MKTLLTILLLTCAASMAAQDTINYVRIQNDYTALSKRMDDMQYNLGMYSAKRRVAYLFAGASVVGYMAVGSYNLNAAPEDVEPMLFAVPMITSIVSIINFATAEKWLRKAGV